MSWFQVPDGDLVLRAKVVVVGSGAGGAFAALTLAEAGLDVVLVEEGSAYRLQPHDLLEALGALYADGGFRTADGTPTFPVVGGRALGGSTVVNSALCFRTPPERVEEWNEQSGGALSDAAHFADVQDQVEAVLHVAETPQELLSGNDRVQQEAARKLGWKEGRIRRNTPRCAACGRCNLGCSVGGKFSVDVELLPRAAAAGARIFVGCRVEGVASGRVEGVVLDADGQTIGRLRVDADVVVLSAGAIATPRLLLRSGVASEGGDVGFGLRVQPVITTLAYFPDRVVFAPGATQGHYVDAFVDDDILFETNATMGSILGGMPFVGEEVHALLGDGHRWANTGTLVRDRTDGRVTADAIRYDLIEEDRARIVRALRHASTLWLEGAGADRVVLGLFGRSVARSMAEVEEKLADVPAARLLLYSSHPQASCRLGRATDETGQIREAPGIWAMDASVLPSNVGRNPQISIMTVSRLLAERLAVRLGGTVRPLRAPA